MGQREKAKVTLERLLKVIETSGSLPARMRGEGSWDKGLHFLDLRAKLLEKLRNSEAYARAKNRGKAPFFYWAVAFLQLTNGLRASEAVLAMYQWLKEGKDMFFIHALKGSDVRPVVVPEELIPYYGLLKECLNYLLFKHGELRKIIVNYIHYINRYFIANTHTLRYAFIRYALEQGVDASHIAIMLGHKKLETTYDYARKFDATELLKKLVRGTRLWR